VHGSFAAASKDYDGTTAATITSRSLDPADVVGQDDVTLSGGSATFGSPGAGQNKTVTGTGFGLAGAAKDNYVLASTALTTTAEIRRKVVHAGFVADSKDYDGTDAATITGRTLDAADVVGQDDVRLSGGSATFGSPAVGQNKTVTGTGFGLRAPPRTTTSWQPRRSRRSPTSARGRSPSPLIPRRSSTGTPIRR
jgi:hypothetical protein